MYTTSISVYSWFSYVCPYIVHYDQFTISSINNQLNKQSVFYSVKASSVQDHINMLYIYTLILNCTLRRDSRRARALAHVSVYQVVVVLKLVDRRSTHSHGLIYQTECRTMMHVTLDVMIQMCFHGHRERVGVPPWLLVSE
jgi:hypothetical protein